MNVNKKVKISLAGMTSELTIKNKTGSWRTFRPIVTEECTGCGICVDFCPENCILLIDRKEKTKFKKIANIDYDYCKGCLICANECPFKAINKKIEKEVDK